jgi:hypothetical protein
MLDLLSEAIRNAPQIIAEAGKTEITLAALFLILGAGAIMYMMRGSSPQWRFATLVLWFVTCLITFLIILRLRAPEPVYTLTIPGAPAVTGTDFEVDLGYVEADARHETTVEISTSGSGAAFRIGGANAALQASWASGQPVQKISREEDGHLALNVLSPATSETRTTDLRLVPVSGWTARTLLIKVTYRALPTQQTVTQASGPKASGRGQDYSDNYTVCASAPIPGAYIVESTREWLTGDRSCGSWAHCTPRRAPDGSEACLVFSLQGHSECTSVFSHCDAIRNSEGHVEAKFRLRTSAPTLVANMI